ncbi:kinase-like domain-containing protein, partial [Baffinella frigidus]
HTHVVRFLRLFEEKKKFILVMELAGGGSLAACLPPGAKEGCALGDVRRWVRQLIEALEYIHGRKVYHRDIKPENVLLSENGDVKLADFGLAVVLTPSKASTNNTTAGTECYYAPEKANGR